MGFIIDLFMFILYLFIGATPLALGGVAFFLAYRYATKHPNNKPHFLDE